MLMSWIEGEVASIIQSWVAVRGSFLARGRGGGMNYIYLYVMSPVLGCRVRLLRGGGLGGGDVRETALNGERYVFCVCFEKVQGLLSTVWKRVCACNLSKIPLNFDHFSNHTHNSKSCIANT